MAVFFVALFIGRFLGSFSSGYLFDMHHFWWHRLSNYKSWRIQDQHLTSLQIACGSAPPVLRRPAGTRSGSPEKTGEAQIVIVLHSGSMLARVFPSEVKNHKVDNNAVKRMESALPEKRIPNCGEEHPIPDLRRSTLRRSGKHPKISGDGGIIRNMLPKARF